MSDDQLQVGDIVHVDTSGLDLVEGLAIGGYCDGAVLSVAREFVKEADGVITHEFMGSIYRFDDSGDKASWILSDHEDD